MKNRIERNGTDLDEIVTDGGCHLERMDKSSWFLECIRSDGSSYAIWFSGKITSEEERQAPKRRKFE
jgi:hypothetical protein